MKFNLGFNKILRGRKQHPCLPEYYCLRIQKANLVRLKKDSSVQLTRHLLEFFHHSWPYSEALWQRMASHLLNKKSEGIKGNSFTCWHCGHIKKKKKKLKQIHIHWANINILYFFAREMLAKRIKLTLIKIPFLIWRTCSWHSEHWESSSFKLLNL